MCIAEHWMSSYGLPCCLFTACLNRRAYGQQPCKRFQAAVAGHMQHPLESSGSVLALHDCRHMRQGLVSTLQHTVVEVWHVSHAL